MMSLFQSCKFCFITVSNTDQNTSWSIVQCDIPNNFDMLNINLFTFILKNCFKRPFTDLLTIIKYYYRVWMMDGIFLDTVSFWIWTSIRSQAKPSHRSHSGGNKDHTDFSIYPFRRKLWILWSTWWRENLALCFFPFVFHHLDTKILPLCSLGNIKEATLSHKHACSWT